MLQGNTISIRGRVSQDAVAHEARNGMYVINFKLCWARNKKVNEEFISEPHFFDCKAWVTANQLAYVSPRLAKGNEIVIISGHLEQETWLNKEGAKRSRVVISVDDPIMGMLVVPRIESFGQETKKEIAKELVNRVTEQKTTQEKTPPTTQQTNESETKVEDKVDNNTTPEAQEQVVVEEQEQVEKQENINSEVPKPQEQDTPKIQFRERTSQTPNTQPSVENSGEQQIDGRSNLNNARAYTQDQLAQAQESANSQFLDDLLSEDIN